MSDRKAVEGWWAGSTDEVRTEARRFVWSSGATALPDRLRRSLLTAGLLDVSVRPHDPSDRLIFTMPAAVHAYVLARSD